ncbi:hypothetical protein QOZ80_9AG0675000 [Eleusine coracana subsp. coracana]|nr:hypothetical protein QOZ80_9AG0675000 [Eleusine coracana subsp. coracana]
MAVTVERVHLATAHAALPGLLPTPAEWKTMLPLLPTPPPCADAVDRWDASKNDVLNKSPPKPGRADAAERWDARKITARSSSGQMSSPEAKKKSSTASSSCARWDSNKKNTATSSSSLSSSSNSTISSSASRAVSRWESSKRPVISRDSSSSDERWDAHKKPRPPQTNDGESSTGSNECMEMEVDDTTPQPKQLMGLYAGPGFLAPPDPTMLPIPSFLLLPRFVAA